MPKSPSKIIKLYRVRIDNKDDELVKEFCEQNTTRYLLVHHVLPHGNPHHHFYCETTISQGNYANKLKAFFNVVGAEYCVQKCDEDRRLEFFSYLFNTKKDNVPTYVSSNGFSPIDIATYQANSKQIAQEFTERMKASKKSQYDVACLVLERFPTGKVVGPETLYDVTIDVLKQQRMMARPNHVKDIIATAMAYSDDRYARQTVKDLTLKFFSL